MEDAAMQQSAAACNFYKPLIVRLERENDDLLVAARDALARERVARDDAKTATAALVMSDKQNQQLEASLQRTSSSSALLRRRLAVDNDEDDDDDDGVVSDDDDAMSSSLSSSGSSTIIATLRTQLAAARDDVETLQQTVRKQEQTAQADAAASLLEAAALRRAGDARAADIRRQCKQQHDARIDAAVVALEDRCVRLNTKYEELQRGAAGVAAALARTTQLLEEQRRRDDAAAAATRDAALLLADARAEADALREAATHLLRERSTQSDAMAGLCARLQLVTARAASAERERDDAAR
jgi:hypothetical protein